jgi:hypothetical protein
MREVLLRLGVDVDQAGILLLFSNFRFPKEMVWGRLCRWTGLSEMNLRNIMGGRRACILENQRSSGACCGSL